MLPNVHNIPSHDTPERSQFAEDIRAFSRGCIRLADPFDFAHYLRCSQSAIPEGDFQRTLESDLETTVKLDRPLPVHLVSCTACPEGNGRMG